MLAEMNTIKDRESFFTVKKNILAFHKVNGVYWGGKNGFLKIQNFLIRATCESKTEVIQNLLTPCTLEDISELKKRNPYLLIMTDDKSIYYLNSPEFSRFFLEIYNQHIQCTTFIYMTPQKYDRFSHYVVEPGALDAGNALGFLSSIGEDISQEFTYGKRYSQYLKGCNVEVDSEIQGVQLGTVYKMKNVRTESWSSQLDPEDIVHELQKEWKGIEGIPQMNWEKIYQEARAVKEVEEKNFEWWTTEFEKIYPLSSTAASFLKEAGYDTFQEQTVWRIGYLTKIHNEYQQKIMDYFRKKAENNQITFRRSTFAVLVDTNQKEEASMDLSLLERLD